MGECGLASTTRLIYVYTDSAVRARYDRIASEPFAAWLDERVFRITEDSPYRRRAIESLNLVPGARVLDLACGTGLNFKLLGQAIGSPGHITGVDISPKSLAVAARRVTKRGWTNVELVNQAIGDYRPQEPFDAVLCTFAMCIIPDWRGAVDAMFRWLKPGGRLAILCMQPSAQPVYRRFNFAWDWMNRVYSGGDITRDVMGYVRDHDADCQVAACFGGFYYLAAAGRPMAP